ncbi:hypothetical protein [Nonomuraea sp. NPDC050786]|uniref:hypothetical protein n=1 Tax=Nonomuraea sp. NPDC050786 TaxID=3154840 RepID=UPI0033BFF7AE
MTVQDLRDVLRERAESPSPANPYRHDEVRSRIRRTSLRRRVTAGAGAVAVIAAGIYLIPGTAAAPDRDTTATATAAAQPAGLPERFTSADGTEYRRLAITTLEVKGKKKTSINVPVSGKPLEVSGRCDGGPRSDSPAVLVNGRPIGGADSLRCSKEMPLVPLIVPRGATEVTVTFDTTRLRPGCVRRTKDSPCLPVEARPANWSLAVYEWTPPARPVEPPQIKPFPDRAAGMKRAYTVRGMWPQDPSFTLTATSESGKIGIDQLCAGDLASRMWFQFRIDGKLSPSSSNCGVWREGRSYPMAVAEITVPKGKRVTISGKMSFLGEYTNRPVRWSVGVFVK